MRGFFKVCLGLAASFATAGALADYGWQFPTPVTPIAHETLHVHNLFMVIALTLFFVVLAIMLYSFWAHRKSRGHQAASFVGPKSRKQWFWVLLPFAGLLILDYGVFGIPAYHAVLMYEDTKTNADLVVKVTGSQWLWQYEFPSEGVKYTSRLTTPREQIDNQQAKGQDYLLEVDNPLVLPVGKKIRFITTSNDVIHSWWVPAFGVKRDAVPGFLREFWATVDTPGTYRGQCSELCGKEHAYMPIHVKVVSQEDYSKWVDGEKKKAAAKADDPNKEWKLAELVARGEKVYNANCAACHKADGAGAGPIKGLVGSKVVLADDKSQQIAILLNGAGGGSMPAWKQLSDTEIAAVITYTKNAWANQTGQVVQPADIKTARK